MIDISGRYFDTAHLRASKLGHLVGTSVERDAKRWNGDNITRVAIEFLFYLLLFSSFSFNEIYIRVYVRTKKYTVIRIISSDE